MSVEFFYQNLIRVNLQLAVSIQLKTSNCLFNFMKPTNLIFQHQIFKILFDKIDSYFALSPNKSSSFRNVFMCHFISFSLFIFRYL